MRVLHVIPSTSPTHGGPSRVLRVMTEALAAEGVRVEVVTTDDDGDGRLAPSPVARQGEGVVYRYFARQVRFYRVSVPAARWMFSHVRDYDVVHIHALFSFTSLAGAFAARRRGVPYVVRPLGVLNPWGRAHRRPRLKRVSLRLLERPALVHAAAIHWTSGQERDQAIDLRLPPNGVIIPNPVTLPDHARTTTGGADAKPVVLFLSRLDPVKGVDVLLEAFAEVVREVPGAELVIAGDGPSALVDEYRRRARQSGTDGHITWTGHVSGELKETLFEQAAVYVLPSRSESFGVAAVEAMARSKPVVVTQGVGIHPEVARSGAGAVVPCEAGPIAAAIVSYLRDPAEGRRAGERGRDLAAERYAPGAVALQLMALYDDVVGGRHPAERYSGGQ